MGAVLNEEMGKRNV